MKGMTDLNTSTAQRIHRISPNNPVRRCLFPVDNIEEKAKDDNCRNNFKEELARELNEKKDKWNFDFDREEALDGPYEWYKLDGDKFVRMEIQRENLVPKGKSMQLENESTPRSIKDDNVQRIMKRRNDRPLASQSVKRKISYD